MNSAEIRTIVRTVLQEHAKLQVDIDTISDSDDLYARGLASFSSVNVMLALEDALDIEFPDSMLRRGVFESVDSLTEALGSILGQTA